MVFERWGRNKSDGEYHGSKQMLSPWPQAAPSCPSISQKSPPPSTKQGPPGAQTGQTGTFLPHLESWQVPAFPPEQSVSTHQGPGQPGDGLCPSAPRHPTVPSRAGTLQGLRPEAGSGWQGSYTHREGSPHTLSSLPGSLGLFWVAGVDPVEV